MNEQEYYIKAEITRALWQASQRIGHLQRLLEEAVAERERLRRHLREVEKEKEG